MRRWRQRNKGRDGTVLWWTNVVCALRVIVMVDRAREKHSFIVGAGRSASFRLRFALPPPLDSIA